MAHALVASRNQVLARDLAISAPTISEDWTGGGVLDLCARYPTIPSFAVIGSGAEVVDAGTPIEGAKELIAYRYPQ
jgi:hypothetical protein